MVKMQYITQNHIIITNLAASYSCSSYGGGAYSSSSVCGATPDTGGLPDTGYNIIIPVALGLALIIAGAILIAKRIIRRKKAVK